MKRIAMSVGALFVVGLALMPIACSSDDPVHGDEMATPGDDSVEAGFARDMSVHHAQAVAMAEAIRDRTADPELKLLATDIALGQQNQIGRMTGWLDEWGLSVGSDNEQMAWMHAAHDAEMAGTAMTGPGMGTAEPGHLDPETGLMPGMATRPQVTALSTLPIGEAEVSFLELMTAHHRAGVAMAEAALALTDRPSVVLLATSIVRSQQAEITVMEDMLAKRGSTS